MLLIRILTVNTFDHMYHYYHFNYTDIISPQEFMQKYKEILAIKEEDMQKLAISKEKIEKKYKKNLINIMKKLECYIFVLQDVYYFYLRAYGNVPNISSNEYNNLLKRKHNKYFCLFDINLKLDKLVTDYSINSKKENLDNVIKHIEDNSIFCEQVFKNIYLLQKLMELSRQKIVIDLSPAKSWDENRQKRIDFINQEITKYVKTDANLKDFVIEDKSDFIQEELQKYILKAQESQQIQTNQ